MKKYMAAAVALMLFVFWGGARAEALSRGDIAAETAVLMDFETGQILFDKGMNRRVFPASTTKIMTCLLAVENSRPDEIIAVSETAVFSITEPLSSHIALTPGEELPMDDALFALMMPSANDAANVIAEHIAGSLEAFTDLMNAKAAEIGAVNTNFANAHGLHDPMHYTTARDMARITRHAAENPMFMRYFGADLHTMAATNLQSEERYFTNYQYMLVPGTRFYNEAVTGGKVGYTHPARHTMSTVAEKDGRTLIAIVMGSGRDEKFTDTKKLLDFGFEQFTRHVIHSDELGSYTVPLTEDGETVGAVRLYAASGMPYLLHNSLAPSDVSTDAALPLSYGVSEKIAAAVNITADCELEAVPSALASMPLTSEIELDAVPALVSVVINERTPADHTLELVLGISAVVLLAAFLAMARLRRYRRRKARLARIGRGRPML